MGPEVFALKVLEWLIGETLGREILSKAKDKIAGDEFRILGNQALNETIRGNLGYLRILNALREKGVFEVDDASELDTEKICGGFPDEDKNVCCDFLEALKKKYFEIVLELGNRNPLTKFILEKIQLMLGDIQENRERITRLEAICPEILELFERYHFIRGKFKDVKGHFVFIYGFIRDNIPVILISVFAAIIFLVALLVPKQFPNILSIENTTAAITALSIIAGALAAILGIIIAVLLVAFEILRRTYAYYASREVFRARELKSLFTFYLFSISISTISVATIEDPLSIRNLNLIYFSICLFLICMIILYPCSKAILTSTRSQTRIKELVDKIDFKTISEFNDTSQQTSSYLHTIEENPVYILSEAAIRTIKEGDRLTPQFILIESTNKLLDLLNQPNSFIDKRTLIKTFLVIITSSANQAIRDRHVIISRAVLDIIERIHSFCAENKLVWHEVVELNETLQSMIEQMMKVGLDTMAKRGMRVIERIFWKHLMYNIPSEKEIWSLHVEKNKRNSVSEDIEKDLQWESVSTEYVNMLYRLTEKAIELKKGDLVWTGLHCLERIATRVTDSKLGDLQKKAIIWRCYEDIEQLVLRCVEQGVYEKIPSLSPSKHSHIYRTLEKDAEFSSISLKSFGNTLIQLTREGIIDTYQFSKLSIIGKLTVDRIDDSPRHEKALHFICDVFDEIRRILDRRIGEKQKMGVIEREKSIEAYFIIRDYLDSINTMVERKGEFPINRKISSILKQFKKREDFEEYFERD